MKYLGGKEFWCGGLYSAFLCSQPQPFMGISICEQKALLMLL